jgi:hypothetical protein
MKYENVEKFVHDNEILAREIAIFKCGNLYCDECIFNIEHVEPGENNCLSGTIEEILKAKYSHESEDGNAKETCNNQHS